MLYCNFHRHLAAARDLAELAILALSADEFDTGFGKIGQAIARKLLARGFEYCFPKCLRFLVGVEAVKSQGGAAPKLVSVGGADFLDFKPRYGAGTVCLQAEIFGQACGILGNNGPIDPQGATKATQFLQLCDQANIPVLFMQNTTGYMVGTQSERAGMIKHGSKMIQAVRNLEVPRITLMTGASFGAGNYGMCGRGYNPDFLYTFPQARMGVMGGEQAGKTMSMVARGKAAAMGQEPDEEAIKGQEVWLADHFDKQSSAFYTSGHLLDDGMIDPRDSRNTLGFLLQTVWETRNRTVRPNSFGIARM
ncbi:hypothetical protein N9J88_06085 [Porticoccaceae bacterium]|nr:hypothetical protein [Porticoccaceae bacterium]